MSCEWELKLDRYVDGELPQGESDELRAHLLTCAGCAAGAVGRLQMKQRIRAAGRRFAPSAELRYKVEQRIGARRPNRMMQWTPVLAAAALLLAAGIGALWRQQARAHKQTLSELADLHIATLASTNRVDVASSDRHTVKPWFQGKIPFTFNLPELKDTSFELIGGRVVYLHQNAGAQLLFADGKHEISVFLFRERGAAAALGRGAFEGSELTFHTETWSEGGLRYVAVGDLEQPELRRLSELFKVAQHS